MSEQTTTPDVPAEDGATPAQPTPAENSGAATQPQEPQQQPEAEPAPEDDNLEWLKNKGIDPTSPDAMAKVAEMYRNAEKAMHEKTTKASELEKSLTSEGQPSAAGETDIETLAAEIREMKLSLAIDTFFTKNPDAKALEAKMTEIVTTRQEIGELVKSGYLSLQDLYNLAKASDASHETKLKEDGGREALERVASKQQAKSVPGSATRTAFTGQVTKENFDSWYAGLSAAERADPKNQEIVNSLLTQ